MPPAARQPKNCAGYTPWYPLGFIFISKFTVKDFMNVTEVLATSVVIPLQTVKNGGLALPQEPGLGVVLDEAAVERFSKDGWR